MIVNVVRATGILMIVAVWSAVWAQYSGRGEISRSTGIVFRDGEGVAYSIDSLLDANKVVVIHQTCTG